MLRGRLDDGTLGNLLGEEIVDIPDARSVILFYKFHQHIDML